MISYIKTFILTFIAIVVAFKTAINFFANYLNKYTNETYIFALFLIAIFLWFFIENLFIKSVYGRDKKYSEVLCYARGCMNHINRLLRIGEFSEETAVNEVEKFCTEIARAYTVITGTQCHVSVKYLEQDVDETST